MTNAHERLRQARKNAGYGTAREAAEAFGWNVNTYKSHENGKRGFHNEAERYAEDFRVPLEWLLAGKNAPTWARDGTGVATRAVATTRAPVIPWVEVERYLAYPEGSMPADLAIHYLQIDADPRMGRRIFFLYVEGESMIAKPPTGGVSFQPGDIVGFDPEAKHKPGDFVLAQVDGEDRPLFRKYQSRGKGAGGVQILDLVPLNEDYETTRIDGDKPGRILGRLVRHIRKF
jgi:phage repressor protein C with HTH and peptisase S24 domain